MSTAGQVIKCKAAVAWESGKPLSIEDVEVAPPKVHEVRIKIVATGVCHTDWEYLYETGKGMKFRPFPLVLGHEAAGEVESVGPEVTDFSPGDKVIPLFLPQCQQCERCLSSKTNLCRKNWANTQVGVLADGTSRISCNGQQVYQFLGVSSFSQYTVVPDTSLAKIRADAPLHTVCLLGCGVSTGYGAAVNTGKTSALESTTDAWGMCVIVGWTETEAMNVVVEKILMGRTLKGTYFGGWKSVQDVPKLVDDYMNKKLKLDEFITHKLPLDQINKAFELLKLGTSIRTVISLWPEKANPEVAS